MGDPVKQNIYCPTLTVYVLWHRDYNHGQPLAESIYTHLCRDPEQPMARGLGIPVRFFNTPQALDLSKKQNALVVVLVDDNMVADDEWGPCVAQIWRQCRAPAGPYQVFPVAVSEHAAQLHPEIAEANFLPLGNIAEPKQTQRLLNRLTHTLCRLLRDRSAGQHGAAGPAPVKVFISHAKRDGLFQAENFREYINQQTQLGSFFDARDIPYGKQWAEVLEQEAGSCALLVVQTDAYASREWCRFEVLEAKRQGMPIVVIDAVNQGQKRGFPYLGNTPTIRWQEQEPPFEEALGLLLLEVLRARYFSRHLENVRELYGITQAYHAIASPPELLTLLALKQTHDDYAGKTFFYPDPPLGTRERELLHTYDPNLTLATPTLLPALEEPSQDNALLKKSITIGLSISDSPEADLAERGLGTMHLNNTFIEISRHLLAKGASLAYGGDHRVEGFTNTLFDLTRDYDLPDKPPPERIRNYLAWYLYQNLTAKVKASLKGIATVEEVPLPAELKKAFDLDAKKILQSAATEDRYIRARCLSAMREQMNNGINARILLGGQLTGFQGFYPGLLEEACLAVKKGRALYLLGGFGGCTGAVIEALQGGRPETLTLDYQQSNNDDYAELIRYCKQPDTQISTDYEKQLDLLRQTGIKGLNNGLDETDNRRLFETDDLDLIIASVLKGLQQRFA